MSKNFYILQSKMESLITGDLAKESLILAEQEYMNMTDDERFDLEIKILSEKPYESIDFYCMEIKDDDGNWRRIYDNGINKVLNEKTGNWEVV